MPGFDGTGPRGRGPMSGGGRGFCALQLTENPGDGVSGFAGSTGRPVEWELPQGFDEMSALKMQSQHLEMTLAALRLRIRRLDLPGKQDRA